MFKFVFWILICASGRNSKMHILSCPVICLVKVKNGKHHIINITAFEYEKWSIWGIQLKRNLELTHSSISPIFVQKLDWKLFLWILDKKWRFWIVCDLPCKASSSKSTRASLHSVLLASSRINRWASWVQVALMSSGVGILFMKVFLRAAPTEFISSSIAAFRAASRCAGDPNKHLWFTDG